MDSREGGSQTSTRYEPTPLEEDFLERRLGLPFGGERGSSLPVSDILLAAKETVPSHPGLISSESVNAFPVPVIALDLLCIGC